MEATLRMDADRRTLARESRARAPLPHAHWLSALTRGAGDLRAAGIELSVIGGHLVLVHPTDLDVRSPRLFDQIERLARRNDLLLLPDRRRRPRRGEDA